MLFQYWNWYLKSEIVISILKLIFKIWNCSFNSEIVTSILKLPHQFWNCHINSEIVTSVLKLPHQFWNCLINSKIVTSILKPMGLDFLQRSKTCMFGKTFRRLSTWGSIAENCTAFSRFWHQWPRQNSLFCICKYMKFWKKKT